MAKYVKGLNKDTAPIDQPEGSYRYAKNILSNETAGAISNEPGTSVISEVLNKNELVIGSIETTEDKVVLYTVNSNSNRSRIYLYDATIDNMTVVLQTTSGNIIGGNDVDLKFNKNFPIEGTYKIDPNGELIVYWTDNLNPPRSLNITRQQTSVNGRIYGVNPATSPNKNYIDRLNLFPHSGPVPSISFNSIASGGALKSGTYYLFLAYADKNFTQTNYVSYSIAVPIVEDTESVLPIERYDGCSADTQTGKSIVWDISNLNTDYEFLRPVVVHRSFDKDGAPAEFAFKLNDIDISGTTATVAFSGLEGYESSSVEDVIIDAVAYDTAKTLTQLDSVLYLGNLTGTKDVGYQKYANAINLNTVTHTFDNFDPYVVSNDNLNFGFLDTDPPFISKQDGYRSMDNLSSANQRRGYMRDEVYAFYIAFILNDGSMSYAYHIPGREQYTNVTDDDLAVEGNGSVFPATFDETDLITNTIDPELNEMAGGKGRIFHFYDSSAYLGPAQTNFWHNENEIYPNTDDYLVFDGLNQIGDLRGSNVRHHHMPSNANPFRRTITDNTSTFTGSTSSQVIRYYFFFNDLGSFGAFGSASTDNTDVYGVTDTAVDTQGWITNLIQPFYLDPALGNFDQAVVNTNLFDAPGTVNILWQNDFGILGGIGQGTVNGDSDNGGTTADGDWEIEETGGTWPTAINFLSTTEGFGWWDETVYTVNSSGNISHEVDALGVQFSNIKIPKEIADKVQGFRIYYAEREHANRRILGQDVIKNTGNLNGIDLGSCGAADATYSTRGSEDFILSGGTLYNGSVNTATFHDFYLLQRKNSLIPATHTQHLYTVSTASFVGPANHYSDVENSNSPANPNECLDRDSYVAFHVGLNYTVNAQLFYHFPLREKCKTYLNGNSLFDGRGIGFGKRIYNLGGESSILLGYKNSRLPNLGAWTDATGGAVWHNNPGMAVNDVSFQDPGNNTVQMQLHNLHAFKTDMYLSYDTQELVWTGFEVVGDELDDFVLKEDGSALVGGTTFTTGQVWGGDTFICRHGYRITHRPEYQGAGPKDHKSVLFYISESTDNINFRHETDKDSSYFPGSPLKKLLDIKADIDLTKKDNMKYSDQYSLGSRSDVKPAIPYPLRESDPSIFKTRVQRSAKADNTSLIDNYRVFLALQFKDLPRNRGSLHKLITLNNLLYLHTQDSLFRTKGKQSLQMSDGTESFVGSGDIFAQDPDEIIQTKYGYGGTQSQWVSMVTKHGYFCMDYRNRRVFLMKDQMYDISKTGLESWFQDNIPYALEEHGLPADFDNPIVGIGFHAEYDERYDRILLTKRDKKPTNNLLNLLSNATDDIANQQQQIAVFDETLNMFTKRFVNQLGNTVITPLEFDDTDYFTDSGWTVSYDVELNVWVSFHDYIPYKYTRSKDILCSFTEGNKRMWGHNSEGNRGRFYGGDYASEFEFIYNSAKDSDKVFYSFEYTIDVTDEHAPTIDELKLRHDHGFNSFYVYTTHQISGEIPIEYMVNTRRVGNEWKINKFRDMAALFNNQQLTYVGPAGVGTFTGSNFGVTSANVAGTITTGVTTHLANTSMFNVEGMKETINTAFINAAKSWDQQRKFRDKWVGIRLKYDNVSKKLINLYSTNVAAKKFYR